MYQLKSGGQAHRVAKLMVGRWVSALRVCYELHVIDMHARIQDIARAGGSLKTRDVELEGVRHKEYTLVRAPMRSGWSDEERDAFNAHQLPRLIPAQEAAAWIPPAPLSAAGE